MIRAAITRPTSIAATSSCDRKISLVETIDIGPVIPPKPNIISLEPISKRSKRIVKVKPKNDQDAVDTENTPDGLQPADSLIPDESASQRASVEHSRTPRSPVSSDIQSEASAESIASSKQSIIIGPVLPSSKPGRDCQDTHSNGSMAGKTITAKIELLKGGCLPGDNIPLKVSIQHTKRVKSMNGVIITLYREGRIDSSPPLSLFADVKGKAAEKLKHEEYYPKSKTGLGGLSLSSAGSSSVFRKDLSQTVTPLIIDPSSLSTVVTASVRVPEDAFPTITGVPGQMISFRYHVEVVVDLGGKLAGDKQLQRSVQPGNLMFGRDDVSAGVLSAWGGSIVDTDYIRREKSVVACLFEVIVGTKDSARLRGRQNLAPLNICGEQSVIRTLQANTCPLDSGHGANETPDTGAEQSQARPDYTYYDPRQFQESSFHQEGVQDYSFSLNSNQTSNELSQQRQYMFVPPPEIPGEDLDEKARIQRGVERLLPSQPPQEDGPSTSLIMTPSAPDDPSGELCDIDHSVPPGHSFSVVSRGESLGMVQSTSAPSVSVLGDSTPHATPNLSEDKQELERHRLMAEASSPSDFPEDQEGAEEGSSRSQYEPTAPVLTEEDEYEGHYANYTLPHANGHNESLPKYER
jgi:arrestin-related trafficking adapter 9